MYKSIFDIVGIVTPEIWLEKLSEHNINNPTHGVNCVCMDEFSRELRKMFPLPVAPYGDDDFTNWLNGPENKLKSRAYYVFRMFLKSF